jgi:hypothetical protein
LHVAAALFPAKTGRDDLARCNLKGVTDRNEKTSPTIASMLSKLLANPKTASQVKWVAASALTQSPDKKR